MVNRALRTAIGSGLLAALAGSSGCTVEGNKTTYGPAFFGALAGVAGGNARTPQGAVAGGVAKEALYLQAQMDNQRQAARDGRSETNVIVKNYSGNQEQSKPARSYVGGKSRPDSEFGEVIITTCRSFEDSNNDGFMLFPEEFRGMTDTFLTTDKMLIYAGSPKKISDMRYELRDIKGNVVDKCSLKEIGLDESCSLARTYFVQPNGKIGLVPGEYWAIIRSGDRFLEEIRFKVVDNSASSK